MKDKKLLISVIIVFVIIFGTFYFLREDSVEKEEINEEASIEDMMTAIEDVFEIEEDLLYLEEHLGSSVVDEDLFERYYEIEEKFFRIRDDYFGEELSENQLREEINLLLKEIEDFEEEMSKLLTN